MELTLFPQNLDKVADSQSMSGFRGGLGAAQVVGSIFPSVTLSATSAQQLPEQGHPAAVPRARGVPLGMSVHKSRLPSALYLGCSCSHCADEETESYRNHMTSKGVGSQLGGCFEFRPRFSLASGCAHQGSATRELLTLQASTFYSQTYIIVIELCYDHSFISLSNIFIWGPQSTFHVYLL